jgi:hypothetical protein
VTTGVPTAEIAQQGTFPVAGDTAGHVSGPAALATAVSTNAGALASVVTSRSQRSSEPATPVVLVIWRVQVPFGSSPRNAPSAPSGTSGDATTFAA